jgi:membrane-bound serine protease (ClpP class)
MSLIVGLLVTAFVLFFFEIFLPGGVLAVIGGVLLLIASALSYTEYGLLVALLILFGGLLGALGLFFVEVRFIANSRFGEQLSLQRSIDSKVSWGTSDDLVNREGVTLTTLAPSGKVQIDGETYTAHAEDGYLSKDTPVTVLRNTPFHLIVSKK